MFLTIDTTDAHPIYQQVADGIKELIAHGKLEEGAALPPVRQLAADLGVNLNTIASAYRELEKDGLVVIKHGSGCEVAPRAATDRSHDELARTLRTALTELVLAGLPTKRILKMVIRELQMVGRGEVEMHMDQYAVVMYVFFWVVRIRGCVRRWPQPLIRGPEWFFNVHVLPSFYEGEGHKLLHRYRMRMFIPFAVDIPLAIAIFLSGRLELLNWLILGLCAMIHINHSYSVDLAERQARPLAVPEAEQPVAAVLLSLTPRRLRDYSNRRVEWALGLSTLVALAWLVRYYFAAPEHHDLRRVFGTPVLMLYAQLGFLFVKRMVISWRSPLPQSQTAEHMAAREETRKYYLRVCDMNRAAAVAVIVFWPFTVNMGPAAFDRVYSIWFAVWLLISVVAGVWIEIKRKQLVDLALRARPVKLPDLLDQSETARWPVCYQPSVPMLLLKGARGYSLNLANRLTHLGAAYLAGWVVLFVLLPKGH